MSASKKNHLLLIEDDTRLAEMVSQYLSKSGFTCTHSNSGADGLNQLSVLHPDLLVLDLMLPDMDGLEICKRVRALSGQLGQTPILMLTAKGDPMDKIVGLEIGADDYLAKPFEPRELLARIKAILRRAELSSEQSKSAQGLLPILQFGSLEIDREARTVRVASKEVDLTAYQFDLLITLAERAGRVLSRDQIMEAVRGKELEAFDRSIDVHMGRIRLAIEADPKEPKRIVTVRGVGYVFSKQQD